MKGTLMMILSGGMSIAGSANLIASLAQDWQAFWGIIFAFCTVVIFGWATRKNQKRQDEKFDEWKRTLKKTDDD